MIGMLLEALGLLLVIAGALFFAAGTLALIRFPGLRNRLHALTKADTLGLGLVIAGLSVRAESLLEVGQMLLIWLLLMASSATACQLLARQASEDPDDD